MTTLDAPTFPDIVGDIDAVYTGKEPWPVRSNYVSGIGGDCDRELVYNRVRWAEKEPFDPTTLQLFEIGDVYAELLYKRLRDAGYKVHQQETPLADEAILLSGRIDLRIEKDGGTWIGEAKTMNPFDWDKINSVEDLAESSKPWLRKYPAQLNTYLGLDRAANPRTWNPWGVFLLINKVTSRVKALWMEFDPALYEETRVRVQRVNDHVDLYRIALEDEYLPDRIEYSEAVCGRCAFRMICLPDVDFGAGLEILDDDTLRDMLARRSELKPLADEFEDVDRAIKVRFKGQPGDRVVSGWKITTKIQERAGYEVQPSTYSVTTIRKL